MIRNIKVWNAWERQQIASTPVDHAANLRWADAALEHARAMGVFPPKDPMEGIEVKIHLARILNCSKNSYKELPKR